MEGGREGGREGGKEEGRGERESTNYSSVVYMQVWYHYENLLRTKL